MTTEIRNQLHNQIELLTDNHAGITRQAAGVNGMLMRCDASSSNTPRNLTRRAFDRLEDLLVAQQQRIQRVRDELAELKKKTPH